MCKTMRNRTKNMTGVVRLLLMGVFFLVALTSAAQEGEALNGRIVDPEGNPVQGAIVNVAESSRIVLSDDNGQFVLPGVKRNEEIAVSLLGYKTLMTRATFDGPMELVLEPDSDLYAHTTPVAFERKQRKFVTEAISVVSGKELEKHPVTVLQNAFTSTVSGVATYEWASEPGWTETAMYIRGLRTMNMQARAPLVIVDDVERDMSFLDAYPIENITILKDAAATAIYGMRGANGVVLVTTRRGEEGRTKIGLTQEVGFQTLTGRMEVQNSYNMALTRNQVRYLDGRDPLYTDEQIEMYRRVTNGEQLEGVDQYRYFNTNWFDEMYRDMAPQNKTNLTLSGGNEFARYFVSFSYLHQGGMWNDKWTEYNEGFSTQHTLNRYNLRSNVDIDVNKYLNVSLDLGGRIDNISQPLTGVFNIVTFGAVEANPMEPVYMPNGDIYASSTAANAGRLLASSGINQNRRRNLYSTINVTGDLGELVKGLKANAVVSFDSYETFMAQQTNNVNSFNYDYTSEVADVSEFTTTRFTTFAALSNPSTTPRDYYFNVNLRGGLKYNRVFDRHSVNAQAFIRTYQNVRHGSESSSRYLSYNGQASYIFDNRYVLSGSVSYMGSDNYADGDRFGLFPGGSIGWVLSEESWLDNNHIDLLKLRASYGRSGQAVTGAGRYPYQGVYNLGNGYSFGTSQSGIGGVYESRAGNYNNKWEISDMANLGLDFDFFGRKVFGSVDVFKEWRSNILVTRSTVPDLLGVAAPQDSYGKVESRGFEVSLGHRNNVGRFNYYVEGMVSWNTNEITEMDELDPNVEWQRKTGNRIFDYTPVAELYEMAFTNSIGGWNIYKFEQWASDPAKVATSHQDAIDNPDKYPYHSASGTGQKLGTAVFKDMDGDRKIDSNDMAPDGFTLIPELLPSLNVGFEWRGFDARMVLTAYLNRSVFLSPAISFSGWSNMGTHEVTKAWGYYNDDPNDPRNINALYPRPTYGGYNAIDSDRGSGTYQNDIWIRSGDFLSLRNVEVGYSLPKSLIAKVNMTECRIYFTGYNLLTISDLPDGADPEKPMSFVWWYPKTRSFSMGLRLGF